MALLNILRYPDPRLNLVAKPVERVDGRIKQLVADMAETMYEAKGIGLAATQIDVHERVIVIDVSEERNQPIALINAELLWASEERVKGEEGCLSIPGVYDGVERAAQVKVRALDENGQSREIEADGPPQGQAVHRLPLRLQTQPHQNQDAQGRTPGCAAGQGSRLTATAGACSWPDRRGQSAVQRWEEKPPADESSRGHGF